MEKKETIWTYNFVALFLANVVLFFGQFMMSTLLPKYLSALGHSTTVIGFVVGMFSVTALGTRPITGPLIDGMNKKKLFMCMLSFTAITSFGYAMVTSVPGFICFRLLSGVGSGCSSALALTMATESLPESKLASGISVYGLSSVLPNAFGPGLGLAIAEKYSYRVAFVFSGVLIVIAILMASRMRFENKPGQRISFRLNNIVVPECLIPASLLMLLSLARNCFSTYLVIYITEYRCIEGISLYYTIYAAALIVTRPIMGKLADRFGIPSALYPSYIIFAAGLLTLAFCTKTWQLWLAAVLIACGYGVTQSQHQALTMKVAPKDRRGAASTTAFFGIDVGDLLAPVINGALITAVGYQNVYLLALVPLGACALGFTCWLRKNRGIPDAPESAEG